MALSAIDIAWRAKVAEGLAAYRANIEANEAERKRSEGMFEKALILGHQNAAKEKARKSK